MFLQYTVNLRLKKGNVFAIYCEFTAIHGNVFAIYCELTAEKAMFLQYTVNL